MPREVERIADQLQRALAGNAWHGASLSELLADVSADEARAKPVAGAHSIWELVHHLTVWADAVRRRLGGEHVEIALSGPEDWPPVARSTAADWERPRNRLMSSSAALRDAIARFDDARLDETSPGREYSYYVLMHGAIQHALYHGGQIGLLKRTLRSRGER